jgi:hypothetical protein
LQPSHSLSTQSLSRHLRVTVAVAGITEEDIMAEGITAVVGITEITARTGDSDRACM